MISAFLIFCLVIGAIGFSGENDWTSVLICGGLVLFVLFCHSVSVESDKAYVNRMHYWSQSPAERERERRRVRAQVDREEREARERRVTKEERKLIAWEREDGAAEKEKG